MDIELENEDAAIDADNDFEITDGMYDKYVVHPASHMKINMCNATALLGIPKLNLVQIVNDLCATWNPAVFATATVRLMDPKCCILVFCTGKVVCTGAKSELAALKAFGKFIQIIRKTYMNAQLLNMKIELMTANCSVGYPLDLRKISRDHRFVTSLTDLFPGLRWYKTIPSDDKDSVKKDVKITLLVFVNGNIVVTGAKSRYQLMYVWDNILKEMPKYRCSHDDLIKYQETRKRGKKSRKKDSNVKAK